MHKKLLLLCVFMLLAALSVSAHDTPAFSTLEHDGQTRTYTLHAPANLDASAKHPLVIVLHPASSSGKAMEAISGFDAEADAHNFFVVYPDSVGFVWDDYHSLDSKDVPKVDDLGFLKALITELAATYPIDPDQVHLVGMANGGAAALRMACDASDTFASFVIVSAQMWSYQAKHCPEVGVVKPMLFVHGMADAVYEIGGHFFSSAPESITTLDETISFWRDRYGCAAAQGVNSKTVLYEYGDCRGGGLWLYAVPNAGGAWYRGASDLVNPGGPDYTSLISAFIRGDQTWREQAVVPQITGPQRTYTLYIPPTYTGDAPVPLIVLLHGRSGTGSGMAQITQMNTIAQRDNFVVVYPDGLRNQWNYGRDWPGYGADNTVNEEVFLTRLLHSLNSTLALDSDKRYVAGFSNGGFMTQRLACTMHREFAAFASVAATAPYGLTQGCADVDDPVPLMFVHGTADAIVPWMGTPLQLKDGRTVYTTATMDNTLGFWVDHNGCSVDVETPETLPKTEAKDPTETTIFTLKACPADGPVVLYAVKEGGHRWHGTDAVIDDLALGISSPDFKASEVIWAFFQQFPLKK